MLNKTDYTYEKVSPAEVKHTYVKNTIPFTYTIDKFFTIKFNDRDGRLIEEIEVLDGGVVNAPNAPIIEGYRFTGWDKTFANATENITVKATYIQQFTVTFVDHNGVKVLKIETVDVGTAATAPDVPNKQNGDKFDGWDKSFSAVIENMTVMVQYKATPMIFASDVTANIGDNTVNVVISVANNPGIVFLMIKAAYDSTLELTNVAFSSAFGSYVTTPPTYTNPQNFSMMSPVADVNADGTFVTLTFKISDSVTTATVANIQIDLDDGNIFNSEAQPVTFAVTNGTVTIQ